MSCEFSGLAIKEIKAAKLLGKEIRKNGGKD